MRCFSCFYSLSKENRLGDYEGQERSRDSSDQPSTPSKSETERINANAFQLLRNVIHNHQLPAAASEKFTMKDILSATCNWSKSNELGQGAFGCVYKGKLRDGRIVAIKRSRMDGSSVKRDGAAEFRAEVEMLSQVEHLNLVKLFGYLEEGPERILIMEYVPNGHLGQHIDVTCKKPLDIRTRLDIAIDIGHALTYLHLYADRPIIHRDIKPENILLTERNRAKVADFGFSRLGAYNPGETCVATQVKGTHGYVDPEYAVSNKLHPKSDVYSYGILLLGIITGRRPYDSTKTGIERFTLHWAREKLEEGRPEDILDCRIERTPASKRAIQSLAILVVQCTAPARNERPSMKKVTEFLWNVRKNYAALNLSESGHWSNS